MWRTERSQHCPGVQICASRASSRWLTVSYLLHMSSLPYPKFKLWVRNMPRARKWKGYFDLRTNPAFSPCNLSDSSYYTDSHHGSRIWGFHVGTSGNRPCPRPGTPRVGLEED